MIQQTGHLMMKVKLGPWLQEQSPWTTGIKNIHHTQDQLPLYTENGVVVFGQISEVRGQRALMKIEGVKDTKRSLVTNFSGGIHISQADKGYVAKLTDEFHIGDLVEAKVTKIIGLDNVDLTTAEKELGVIKAMCTNCRAYMKQMSKNEVLCPRCGRKERRKISSNYEG